MMNINSPGFIISFFLILFIIIFIFNYLSKLRKVKKKKYDKIGEMNYLIYKFKLDKKKINYKQEILYISLINSFIIASVATFITYLKFNIFFQLIIGFVLLFALIYSINEIYGRHLLKKQRRD